MAGCLEALERFLRARSRAPAARIGFAQELEVAVGELRAPGPELGLAEPGVAEHEPRDPQRGLPLVVDSLERVLGQLDAEALAQRLA